MAKSGAGYQKLADAEPRDDQQLPQVLFVQDRRRDRARRFLRFALFVVVPVLVFFSLFGKTVPGFGPGCHSSPPLSSVIDGLSSHPSESCGTDFHNIHDGSYPLQFGAERQVHFIQQLGTSRGRGRGRVPVNVSGYVRVVAAATSDAKGKIDLQIDANEDNLPVHTFWDPESQRLRVRIDDVYRRDDGARPCVDVRAVVHVPADADLQTLKVEVTTLDISIEDKLGLAADETILTSVASDITFGRDSLRSGARLALTSVSGRIRADAPLLARVESFTTSGSNHVDVYPPAAWRDFDTAFLNVHSVSGDITVHDPIDHPEDLPAADYVRKASTVSGTVSASLLFSSKAEFAGQPSGDLEIKLRPVLAGKLADADGEVTSRLTTDTVSGDAQIRILEPTWIGKQDGSWALYSSHKSVSGDVDVRLPDAWEGKFASRSLTGKIEVRGKDVHLGTNAEETEAAKGDVEGAMFKSVSGRKGEGNSKLEVRTTTGDIKLVVGEE
ncbi:unnamed protein product [Parascedosporium putredinis]|uniref:Adhesin domain-containing protein n=1 Tax=Parascedosporium putredinis TaxID=1442378 RepID=A0A9P1HBV7_9PEZI|nr:unnamed protein product [Parascedosporium putredinis]CAI8004113.1 unnamed protein product [Parascedosporium putredinis]